MVDINRTSFSVHTAKIVDKDTGVTLYPVGFAVDHLVTNGQASASAQTYSQDDLRTFPVLAGSATLSSEEAAEWFPPRTDMTYDLILTGNGEPKAKAVVESMADMQRIAEGEAVNVNWYRKVGNEWEFVERRPLKFNYLKRGE